MNKIVCDLITMRGLLSTLFISGDFIRKVLIRVFKSKTLRALGLAYFNVLDFILFPGTSESL